MYCSKFGETRYSSSSFILRAILIVLTIDIIHWFTDKNITIDAFYGHKREIVAHLSLYKLSLTYRLQVMLPYMYQKSTIAMLLTMILVWKIKPQYPCLTEAIKGLIPATSWMQAPPKWYLLYSIIICNWVLW